MAASPSSAITIIYKFVEAATARGTAGAQSIECCGDSLTYGQLLSLALKIAEDLRLRFGEKPTVAFVSENHPYVLAVILATWLLGGVAAPLDYHAPEALLRGMLEGIRPACVVLPETAEGNVALVKEMGLVAHTFAPAESGIPHLTRKFNVLEDVLPSFVDASRTLPSPDDDAIFLYTSSASSVANLKCVPITHGTLFANTNLELERWRARRGAASGPQPERFRVLGWGPFSHIMALAHDFSCHCVLVVGCYVFAVPPSTYPISADSGVARPAAGQAYDVGTILLQTAARTKTDVFAGVPWVFRRLMEECARNPEYLELIRGYRQLMSGGALTDNAILKWARENELQFEVSVGMTELAGAIFETDLADMTKGGYPASGCLVAESELILVDDAGVENDSYGELVVRSKYISKGYHNFASSVHSTGADGRTTFRTGDMYSYAGGRFVWEGRCEDYIQLASAELLDPRIPERQLDASPAIARACFVGNTFLRSAAEFVCAIVEVPSAAEGGFKPQEIMGAFAAVNKTLHPPLRVPVSRVLVLQDGEEIPLTRKRLIWRKALEEKFGSRLKALLDDPKLSRFSEKTKRNQKMRSLEEVEEEVSIIVANGLGLSKELLDDNNGASFAELGMDSNMATRIVSSLNVRFGLDLPMSACHDYVDLSQLAAAITDKLNQKNGILAKPLTPLSVNSADDDVVIIGQSFRLPGNVNDEHSFWHALVEKRMDVLQNMGNDRWNHDSFYVAPGTMAKPPPGSINFTKMGRIEVASYDNSFFGISPAEAYYVTPSARSALEVAVEALEDANIPLSEVKGSNCGVFVAQGPEFGFSDLVYEEKGFTVYDRYYGTGVADSAVSGRISYFLDVHGPSVTLNTACSGGLVALDNAVMSIKHGESEMALVCSVNVHVWPGNFSFLSANQMSSIHGRCATFSKDADGYVPSEGAMAFVVKNKQAALRDGDKILGVVKSTSVRHNGRSQGLVAPNTKAQIALQKSVIAGAGITAADVDFIEAHGTGTVLGDFMEIQAVNEVFAGSHTAESPLVIGAAKTVFGHTESTAGLVGVAKALQSLRHGVVPGLAHLDGKNLNPRIDMTSIPLNISHLSTPLQRRPSGVPLRALSLSFGFAGTIAAVILEEHQFSKTIDSASTLDASSRPSPHLFVVSTKTEKALQVYLRNYLTFCLQAKESDLANICYTSCVGREHYRFRFACACSSLKELIGHLNDVLSSKKPIAAMPSKPRIAFAFPGQGSQWQGMGQRLSDFDENFSVYLMDYAEQASELLGIDLKPILFEVADGTAGPSPINETHISQACIFVFQCAMVEWLHSIGIRPNAILTHSLGEIAAAVASGAMDFRKALDFVVVRSNAMRPELTNGGIMAAIRSPFEPIMKRISALGLSSLVTIAAYNSDTQHVVSGDEQAVRKLVADLSAKGIKGTVLPVNQGFHSQCIDSSLGPIRECLERQESNLVPPTIPYYSSVEGRSLKPGELLDADYWVTQARQPVRFSSAAHAMLSDSNCHVIVDVGPQNVIAHLLKDASARSSSTVSITSLCDRPITNTLTPLMQSLATLFMNGVTPDFQKLYAGQSAHAKKVAIPTYPWQRQRHYPTIIPSRTGSSKASILSDSYSKTWEIGKELGPLLEKNHTLDSIPIIPAAALAMFVSLEVKKARPGSFDVDMRILKPMLLEALGQDKLELAISGNAFSCVHRQGTVEKGVICSGTLRPSSPAQSMSTVTSGGPDFALNNGETYEKFRDNLVHFGSNFKCLQKIEVWSDHATGTVEVPSTGNVQHDFVRKMDAILHMFGAIAPEGPPELKSNGSFLPSAINGLALHTDSFPERFACHYRLPIDVAPNSRKMTASFEVRSESGALLASCTDYIVSWIPNSVPITRSASAVNGTPRTVPNSTVAPKAAQITNTAVENFIANTLQGILGMTPTDFEGLGQ
ncbi:hypothetical protein DFH11DRAFT_1514493 [Phellopilus nigrolimitatus]|nr:hypothetical protein DFH11DRAFT_1514493 [Phellopilus nigrolimitatus]